MFKNYKVIFEVLESGSFSKAAENLYISQPSLSALVKRTEDKVGYKIFDRSSVPVQLTDIGEQYIITARKINEAEVEFENLLNDNDLMNKGSVSIGAHHLYSSYILSDLVEKFTNKYPNIVIKIKGGSSNELESDLENSKIDLLFDNKTLSLEKFDKTCYFSEKLVLAVPKKFIVNNYLCKYRLGRDEIINNLSFESKPELIDLEIFKDIPFLIMALGSDTREKSDAIYSRYNFIPNSKVELDQVVNLYNYAIVGVGAAIINDTVVKQIDDKDNLYYYKLNAPEASRDVSFYRKKNKHLKKSVATFLEELKC